jgi:hypothetical protein
VQTLAKSLSKAQAAIVAAALEIGAPSKVAAITSPPPPASIPAPPSAWNANLGLPGTLPPVAPGLWSNVDFSAAAAPWTAPSPPGVAVEAPATPPAAPATPEALASAEEPGPSERGGRTGIPAAHPTLDISHGDAANIGGEFQLSAFGSISPQSTPKRVRQLRVANSTVDISRTAMPKVSASAILCEALLPVVARRPERLCSWASMV